MTADRRLGFAVLFLLLQALLPLHYYLGDDRYDERFAWRMFSPIRMLNCEADFRVNGESLELGAVFHSAWLALVERGRQDVTDAIGRRLCALNPGREITLAYTCTESDGQRRVLSEPNTSLCEAEAP